MENVIISWQEFHKDCIHLCEKLPRKFNIIVTIARGGLLPAGVMANILGIRHIDVMSVHSYDGSKQKEDITIIKPLSSAIQNRVTHDDILVVDDIADTGKTFHFVRQLLPQACYVTPYIKPEGKILTDFYSKEYPKEAWIEFPWD
jgi:xanthine phosphoribosyltransferase